MKIMKMLFSVLLLLFSGGAVCSAEISIGTLYDYIDRDQSTYLKRVRNQGSSTAFVKVSIHEILYDENGMPYESDELTDSARDLVASPSRLIIPANGVQATRLLYMGERDKERYFRVRFIPVLPKVEDGFDLDAASNFENEEKLSAGVNILTGFGSILFVMPKNPTFNTEFVEVESMTTLKNNGNTTIVLDFFEECTIKNEVCSSPNKIHLLPNMEKQLMKNRDHFYRFLLIEGDKSRNIVLNR